MNNAEMNMRMPYLFNIHISYHLATNSEVALLDHMDSSIFIFFRHLQIVFPEENQSLDDVRKLKISL
jgi:hypothetical protein